MLLREYRAGLSGALGYPVAESVFLHTDITSTMISINTSGIVILRFVVLFALYFRAPAQS